MRIIKIQTEIMVTFSFGRAPSLAPPDLIKMAAAYLEVMNLNVIAAPTAVTVLPKDVQAVFLVEEKHDV